MIPDFALHPQLFQHSLTTRAKLQEQQQLSLFQAAARLRIWCAGGWDGREWNRIKQNGLDRMAWEGMGWDGMGYDRIG